MSGLKERRAQKKGALDTPTGGTDTKLGGSDLTDPGTIVNMPDVDNPLIEFRRRQRLLNERLRGGRLATILSEELRGVAGRRSTTVPGE